MLTWHNAKQDNNHPGRSVDESNVCYQGSETYPAVRGLPIAVATQIIKSNDIM